MTVTPAASKKHMPNGKLTETDWALIEKDSKMLKPQEFRKAIKAALGPPKRYEELEADTGVKEEEETKKKGCFITTAAVRARGLPDDCDELTTLRQFRDGYMRNLEEGDALIGLYYDIAPQVVAAIGARKDARKVYDHLYSVIKMCVEHIKNGRNEKALEIYVEMVKRLTRQYCLHLLPDALGSAV